MAFALKLCLNGGRFKSYQAAPPAGGSSFRLGPVLRERVEAFRQTHKRFHASDTERCLPFVTFLVVQYSVSVIIRSRF